MLRQNEHIHKSCSLLISLSPLLFPFPSLLLHEETKGEIESADSLSMQVCVCVCVVSRREGEKNEDLL